MIRKPRKAPRNQRVFLMDFSKLIPWINERLIRVPLDLRPVDLRPEADPQAGALNQEEKQHIRGERRRPLPWSAFQAIVQAMPNNQRNRWARAGYPGLQREDVNALRKYTHGG